MNVRSDTIHQVTHRKIHQESCRLSPEDELMNLLEREALSGKTFTFRKVKQHIETRLGKEVLDDHVWDLLSCHGWIGRYI